MKKITTIDVNALEWRDRVNGNSYFAGTITTDFGKPTEKTYIMPFQYGYGSQYEYEAIDTLWRAGVVPNRDFATLWRYCEANNIILRTNKRDALKRELKALEGSK